MGLRSNTWDETFPSQISSWSNISSFRPNIRGSEYMAVQDEVPKSRITLRYRTEINGTPEDITLPLRLLVMGDLSQGTSADRKVDLEERKIRNFDGKNTAAVMKDMKMSVNFTCANKVDP